MTIMVIPHSQMGVRFSRNPQTPLPLSNRSVSLALQAQRGDGGATCCSRRDYSAIEWRGTVATVIGGTDWAGVANAVTGDVR